MKNQKKNNQIFRVEIPLGDDVHHDLTNVLNQLPVDAFNDLFQGKLNFFFIRNNNNKKFTKQNKTRTISEIQPQEREKKITLIQLLQ